MKEFIKWWVLGFAVICLIGFVTMIDEGTADVYTFLATATFALASYGLFQK